MTVTYNTAHGNMGSLTHRERLAIESASSWILVGFVTTEPRWELHVHILEEQFHSQVYIPSSNLYVYQRTVPKIFTAALFLKAENWY